MRKDMRVSVQRSLGLGLMLLVGLLYTSAVWAQALVDIRPEVLKGKPLSQEVLASGRALMAQAVATHGVAAWSHQRTANVMLTDTWSDAFANHAPWPAPQQRLLHQLLLGTFTSRVTFLDGEKAGETWGVQAWAPYRMTPGKQPVFVEDPRIPLALPTSQYLFEFPFRLMKAPILADAGTIDERSTIYQRVYATWETPEPHREHDQFVLWINEENGLIDVVYFTVRVAGDEATSAIFYSDYREIAGVQIPFRQVFTPAPHIDMVIHQTVIEQVRFDAVDRAVLLPDKSRTEVGDRKPGH